MPHTMPAAASTQRFEDDLDPTAVSEGDRSASGRYEPVIDDNERA